MAVQPSEWACLVCTFLNSDKRRICEMCQTRRWHSSSSSQMPGVQQMQWECPHCQFRNHDAMRYCENKKCRQCRHSTMLHTYFPDPYTDKPLRGAASTYDEHKPEGRSQPAEKLPTEKELRKARRIRKKKAKAKAKKAKSSTLATGDADGTSSLEETYDPSTNPLSVQCNYFSNSSEEEYAHRDREEYARRGTHGPESGTRWGKGASKGTIGDPSSNPCATRSGYIIYNSEEYEVAATVATQRPASRSSSGVPFEICYVCQYLDAMVYFKCSHCNKHGEKFRIAICQECSKAGCPNCGCPIEESNLDKISGMSNEVSCEELESDDPRNANCPVRIFYH